MPSISLDQAAFDSLSPDIQGLAKKDEASGRFIVDMVPDSFRQQNIALVQERDNLKSTFEAFTGLVGEKDPVKFKTTWDELLGLKQKLSDKELVDQTSFEKALETRTAEMRQTHEASASNFQKTIAQMQADIEAQAIKSEREELRYNIQLLLGNPASEFNQAATVDIVSRAMNIFKKNKDGNWIATSGGQIMYDDAAVPLTFETWLKKLAVEVPYYLKPSAGGGAGGGRGAAGTVGDMSNLSMEEYMKVRKSQTASR